MALNHDQVGMNIASVAGADLFGSIEHAQRAGLGAIELLGFTGARHSQGDLPGVHFDDLSEDEAAQLREATASFARKAVHAPLHDTPLFSYHAGVRQLAKDQMAESIRLSAHIGGGPVIVHTNAKRGFAPEEYAAEMRDTFRRLGDIAGEAGVTIAVENLIGTVPASADGFCALIWNIDHPAVGACIDTGHTLGFVEPQLRQTEVGAAQLSAIAADMARSLGPKLLHVHIHDVRARDWRDHREVGTGIIDYAPFFSALAAVGYSGALSLEMEEPDRAGAIERSATRIRQFIDVANAA